MEGKKTNFWRRLKQFDGLTWLILTPAIFCDRATPLLKWRWTQPPHSVSRIFNGSGFDWWHLTSSTLIAVWPCFTYALPAWRDFLLSSNFDNSFLKRAFKYVFFSPSCSHFWISLITLTKHCLTVCLKTALSP